MTSPDTSPRIRWTLRRRAVVATAAALGAIVWTHGLAALLRHLGPPAAPLAADALSIAAVGVALVGAALVPRRGAWASTGLAGLVAAVLVDRAAPGAGVAAIALAPVGAASAAAGAALGRRLPSSLDRAGRLVAVAWAVLAMVAVVQTGRLAAAVTDHDRGLVLTTTHPFWYQHECLGAYLYGAEMAARGEPDLYHPSHYPGLHRHAEPESSLEGVALDDPYQYPPQFLLLPRVALALTDHVPTIRALWFALQASAFVTIACLLATWVGGVWGRSALWLLPAVLASFPALHTFLFGQVHLLAVAAAVAAMLAFERGRAASGGALLAAAILSKVFPLVLVPLLVVQRRFRELAWTAAFGLVATAVAFAVLGPAPFVAFVDGQIGRLADGSAFAFDEAWPELAELVVVDNQGAFGLARKLGASKPLAGAVGRAFGLAVLAAAALVGLRRASRARAWRAAGWLALLGLGSLSSPGAWGDYVPVTAVWLLSLLAPAMARGRLLAAGLGAAWLWQWSLLGTMPFGDWAPIALMVPVSAVGSALMLALFASTLAVRPRAMADSGLAEPGLPRPSETFARAA